jgi:hypothetical protein
VCLSFAASGWPDGRMAEFMRFKFRLVVKLMLQPAGSSFGLMTLLRERSMVKIQESFLVAGRWSDRYHQ